MGIFLNSEVSALPAGVLGQKLTNIKTSDSVAENRPGGGGG